MAPCVVVHYVRRTGFMAFVPDVSHHKAPAISKQCLVPFDIGSVRAVVLQSPQEKRERAVS